MKEDIEALLDGSRTAHFEDLIYVRSGNERVNILVDESKDIIHNVLIIFSDGVKNSTHNVFVNLRGRFSMADVNKIIQSADSKKSEVTKTEIKEED